MCLKSKPGVSKIRPEGQIRPAGRSEPARQEFDSANGMSEKYKKLHTNQELCAFPVFSSRGCTADADGEMWLTERR